MTKKQKRERMSLIVEKMKEIYPDATCALQWEGEPWRLLIMGMLSAQCTDARVNLVCEELFRAYPTASDLAEAPIEEIEGYIRSCGLYHTKAKNAKAACALLVKEFGGVLPDNMDDLLRLPGVGRKTANLILGDVYGKEAYVCDTHCIRITTKLGLHKETDQKKIELALKKLLPPEESNDFCHRLVLHGRAVCQARSPKCENCCMNGFCRKTGVK